MESSSGGIPRLMPSSELDYTEHASFALGGDGYYDWVDVKHFELRPAELPARTALQRLIEHVRFRDTYAEADSQDRDAVEIHGPYRLECIDPGSYQPISAEEALKTLRAFVSIYGTPEANAERLRIMEAGVSPILAAADEVFRLGDLVEAAQHSWGWVLDNFTELVVISRSAGRLSLIVAAAD